MRFFKLVLAAFLLLMPGYAVAQAITGRTVNACLQDSWPVGENHYIEITTTGGVCLGNPGTAGGLSMFSAIMANSTNSNSVKGTPGQVYHYTVFNNSTAIGYLKFYDTASAPTCGSGTPVKRVMVPGNTNGAGVVSGVDLGSVFASGIGICMTGAIGDADTTAVAASEFIVNIDYK